MRRDVSTSPSLGRPSLFSQLPLQQEQSHHKMLCRITRIKQGAALVTLPQSAGSWADMQSWLPQRKGKANAETHVVLPVALKRSE